MGGFERRKEQSKGNILRATETLVTKYGISKVTVTDIAHQAGVSQVTIYNLFGSKDKLIHDCIQAIANSFFERFREISRTDKPYLEKLEDFFQYEIELRESYPEPDDIEIRKNPQLKKLMEWLQGQANKLFVEFVKEGQNQGYLNPDMSEEAIVAYFEIMMQGMNTNPELHARVHHNPKLFHDWLLIMLYGFGRIDNPIQMEGSPRRHT
jgi:AcrR family transcriptional regulator